MKTPANVLLSRLLAATGALAALAPATARATHDEEPKTSVYASPGPLFVFRVCCGSGFAFGLGGELAVTRFKSEVGAGGFFQYTHFFAAEGFERLSAGAHLWRGLGAELGLAYQSASALQDASVGMQAMPFASVGFAYVGLRFTLPGASGLGKGPSSLLYLDIVTALKFPLPLTEDRFNPLGEGGGRPLLVEGQPCVAGVTASCDWA